jgi:DNA polymerase-3 subunit delta'
MALSLPHLLGNPRLKAAVAAMADGPGAPVLLEGPAGSGKRTAARDLAQALLCTGDAPPCGACPACARFLADSHPDFDVLHPFYDDKAVDVKRVRALRARAFLKPREAARSVFIIEAADRLNPSCQNALLKVLEEPPDSVFILLCENRGALLPTVRSRCMAFVMEPLSEDDMRAALRGKSGDIDGAIARAGGVLGRALAALSGETPAWQAAADGFVDALTAGELAIFEACNAAGELKREDYTAFCEACGVGLAARARQTGDGRYLRVFDYLEDQKQYFVRNPGVKGLAGALCARCGAIFAPDPPAARHL